MVFYEGAVQYETLKEMPFPELFDLLKYADEITEERKAISNGK
jgi:hypothetical protein